MDFVLGFIVGFGWWFWGICIVEFMLLTWFVEEELGIATLVSLAVALVLLWWLAEVPIWTWVRDNPGQLFMYALYYILIGLAWSVGKYYFVLVKIRHKMLRVRKQWAMRPASNDESWDAFRKNRLGSWNDGNYTFSHTSKKLVFWAMVWPPSMFWTLLNDPISWFFKFLIRDIFVGVYKSMYHNMVGKHMEEPTVVETKG